MLVLEDVGRGSAASQSQPSFMLGSGPPGEAIK